MASSLGVSTPRWDDYAMENLLRTVRDLAARQTDTDNKMRLIIDRRGDVEQLAQRTEMVHDENMKLRGQLDVMSASIRNHMGAVVDAEVAGNFAHNNLVMQKQIQETIGAFQLQYRQFMNEAQQDIKLLEERIKDQLAYNLEMSARDSRRDLVELNNRVEQAHRIVEDGSDLKRHMADLDTSIDVLSRRIESVASEMLQKFSSQGGVHGRVQSIEAQLIENRQAMMLTLEELRNDVDRKAADADAQRLAQRVDQFSAEFKALRTTSSKLEAKVQEINQLGNELNALNARMTGSISDFEGSTLAVSSELGEVKGKIENHHAKLASVENKIAEIASRTHQQFQDHAASLTMKLTTDINTRVATLERKIADKVDGVLVENKSYRQEARGFYASQQAKLEEHETTLARLVGTVDSVLVDRINYVQQQYTELTHRSEMISSERTQMQNEMRRELSTVQEVIQGLQQQYDSLLTDSAQRNEIWNDVTRDLKSRVEFAETQLTSWRTMVDGAMDDMRSHAAQILSEHVSSTVANVEQLMSERDRQKNLLQRLEDDTKTTASILKELDEKVSAELSGVRDQKIQVGKDILGFKTHLDRIQNQVSEQCTSTGRAVLDLDKQYTQQFAELKDKMEERNEDTKMLRREMDFVTNSKIPAIELRITNEISSGRINAPVLAELAELRGQVDGMVRRADFDDIQHEVRALVNATRDVKNQTDRLEMGARTTQTGLDDVRVQLNQGLADVQNEYMTLRSDLTSVVSRIDPTLKRSEQQLGQVQRAVRDLQAGEEKTQQIVNDVRQEHLELHATLTSTAARVELLAAKPLATEQSVKGLQANLDAATASMQRDINLMQSHFQEMYEKMAADQGNKTKAMASGVMEFRQRIDILESTLKEYENAASAAIAEIRGTTEEQAGTLGSRLDNLNGEVKRVRAMAQQFEVQLNDTRALSRTLTELREQFNTTLEDLRVSTVGIGAELTSVKSRVERQDRAMRELVGSEIEGVGDRLTGQISQTDEKLMRHINEAVNKVRQAQQAAEEEKKKNDEEKNALRGAMTQILQKQDGIDKINEFGVREIARLKQDVENFQNETTTRNRRFMEENDKRVKDQLNEYDTKLTQIFQQEQAMAGTREFGAKAVVSVRSEVQEVTKFVHTEFANLISIFELTRDELAAAAEQGTPEQRVRILLRKPVFQSLIQQVEKAKQAARSAAPASAASSGIGFGSMTGGSMMSTSSTIISASADGRPKPGVGLDVKDSPSGIQVVSLKAGGPADNAGVRVGDIITRVDGISVPHRETYKNFIKRKQPSEVVKHELRRSGEIIDVDIQLGNARTRR